MCEELDYKFSLINSRTNLFEQKQKKANPSNRWEAVVLEAIVYPPHSALVRWGLTSEGSGCQLVSSWPGYWEVS